MAYNEILAEMIRDAFAEMGIEPQEKKMFGGLAFMINGQMGAGIVKDDLMAKIPKDRTEEFLTWPHVREMDFTGRPMKGIVYVAWTGLENDKAYLRQFLEIAKTYLDSPEAKAAAAKKPKKKA